MKMNSNSSLCRRIQLLPQVIQDLIAEYNVDHRKYTKKLNEEYLSIIYNPCIMCNQMFSKDLFCSVDYFINIRFKLKTYWCNSGCFDQDENHELKARYLSAIDNYLHTITIQLPRQHLELS